MAIGGAETDFILPPEGFSVHARKEESRVSDILNTYKGYVYLGTDLVFEWEEPAANYPAGIEDFANCTLRKFSARLRDATRIPPRFNSWEI